ncbi:MAG: hypothetical protein R3C68_14980 [Myxococcota bacterium]
MGLSAADFSALLSRFTADQINTYITELASSDFEEAVPKTPSRLTQFLLRVALDMTPRRGAELMNKVSAESLAPLNIALARIVPAQVQRRLIGTIGEFHYRRIVQGKRAGSPGMIIGAGHFLGFHAEMDATPEFSKHFEAATKSVPQLLAAKPGHKVRIALLPGFLRDQSPGYMKVNQRALEAMGIASEDIVTLKYGTADSAEENGVKVAAQLRELVGLVLSFMSSRIAWGRVTFSPPLISIQR